MKASLKNYRQAPRKVQLIADLIRGKSVPEAVRSLSFMPQYAAPAIQKLLESAVANARQQGMEQDQLFVKMIAVNKGLVGKRGRPFARGRSGIIRKTMSHVTLELGQTAPAAPKAKKAAKKAVKKAAKKVVAEK